MAKRRSPKAGTSRLGGQPPAAPAPAPSFPKLSARHRRTLDAIFRRPTQANIEWRDIEALFRALGGHVESGSGSRRRVKLGERKAVFHEPHPERVTDKGAVEHVRGFLTSAGVTP